MPLQANIGSRPAPPVSSFRNNGICLALFGSVLEAVWGANPLEALGGFPRLVVDEDAHFHSPLGVNGLVKWSIAEDVVTEKSHGHQSGDGSDVLQSGASVQLNIRFPAVDWAHQQAVYGWTGLQYQAFTRGFIKVGGNSSCRVILITDQVLELDVNDKPHSGGDFYAINRAPLVLNLASGENKIDLRLIRDERSMSSIGAPLIPARLNVHVCTTPLRAIERLAVLPDVVNSRLASPYVSVPVLNQCGRWISVTSVQGDLVDLPLSTHSSKNQIANFKLLKDLPVKIAPGQCRPISLWVHPSCISAEMDVKIDFMYDIAHQCSGAIFSVKLSFRSNHIHEPQKITFLHPSGTVSYAILRPPTKNLCRPSVPVLLNLHGASLEADSQQVRHMLDAVPELNAWLVFPAGMSSWGGDDWHTWGMADVVAAVSSIPIWIEDMQWNGQGVDIGSWIVTGHSNGGQGAWFISTHQPDKVFATASISGYSSIQNYIPYTMWRKADPLADAIIQSSLSSYRHEVLLSNLSGKLVYQQHGAEDNNVPPYHSRLMSTLLKEHGCSSQYVELPNRGHWFKGVMTTPTLCAFYSSALDGMSSFKKTPRKFDFIVPNSGDIGSRGGISIEQLKSPDVAGRIAFHCDENNIRIWHLKTLNAHRLCICFDGLEDSRPYSISIDGQPFCTTSQRPIAGKSTFVKRSDGWNICNDRNWRSLSARYGKQRGNLDAILRTRSTFKIRILSAQCFDAALQVSRNLMQYYGADSDIDTLEPHYSTSAVGNVITVAIRDAVGPVLAHPMPHFPVTIENDGIKIQQQNSDMPKHVPGQPGMGAVLLRPRPDEALELVLWGWDSIGPHLAWIGATRFYCARRPS